MKMPQPVIEPFFDPATWTVTYVVSAGPGTACAIVDPVLDYDPKAGRTSSGSADRIARHVRKHDLRVEWILETHAHADHLTGAHYLREALGGRIAIGRDVTRVQEVFRGIFNLGAGFPADGSQFDRLFGEGDTFGIGELEASVIATPGHTPACVAYRIGDAVFVGDTLFMPDVGTARCDFPGGDAATLYRSISRLLSLPSGTRLFMCHDYPPDDRDPQWETTVADQRERNIHVHDGIRERDFVAMRKERDATLEMPNLLLPSLQVNIRAGELPAPEGNGTRYLKIPLNAI